MATEETVEAAEDPSVLARRLGVTGGVGDEKPNPWQPDGAAFEFTRWEMLTPEQASSVKASFHKAVAAMKSKPSALAIAKLELRLARGRNGEALLQCEWPAPDAAQLGMPPGQVNIRRGAVPVGSGVSLMLDDARNPESEIERRKLAWREQHIAREQEAARQRAIEEQRQHEEIKKIARARRWLSRPHVERTLLRLAHARPQDADLLRALAAALITDADGDDQVPPGDIDLLPQVRPF